MSLSAESEVAAAAKRYGMTVDVNRCVVHGHQPQAALGETIISRKSPPAPAGG